MNKDVFQMFCKDCWVLKHRFGAFSQGSGGFRELQEGGLKETDPSILVPPTPWCRRMGNTKLLGMLFPSMVPRAHKKDPPE